jgi:outer membrane protein
MLWNRPVRRGWIASWGLAAAALAFAAQTARADVERPSVPMPSMSTKLIPIIPVREREDWYPDRWDVRMNGGFATDSDLGQIATGDFDPKDEKTSLVGMDFGRPIVTDFRDWPVDFAWRVGLIRYLEHGTQADSWGQTLYLKMFLRPFPWERHVSTRVGIGEGVSYAWRVPTTERAYSERHGENTSRFLNYLDVSLDVNVGDLVRNERARSCWLGVVISHRSGVFGLVDIFGNVKSGSNYNTAALECGF